MRAAPAPRQAAPRAHPRLREVAPAPLRFVDVALFYGSAAAGFAPIVDAKAHGRRTPA
jgi:hypothetical protein